MVENKKIFISHASLDKVIVQTFVDDILIGAMNFNSNDIFCTSVDGMKIESGENWRDSIKENLKSAEVVFLLITPHYISSEICLNEMGAAWVCCENVITLIVEPIKFDSIGSIMSVKQAEILNDEKGLDRVRDKLESLFISGKSKIKSDRWTAKKHEMITKVQMHLNENPFELPITMNTVYDLSSKNDKLMSDIEKVKTSYKELLKEKEFLKKYIDDLEKTKDKENIIELRKKHGLIDYIDEFKKIIDQVQSELNKIHPVIVTLVYNEFSNKNLGIEHELYRDNIEEAKANGIIDDNLNIIWNIKQMKKVEDALNALKNFDENNLLVELYEYLENEYPDVEIDIYNLNFWKTIINTKIYYGY